MSYCPHCNQKTFEIEEVEVAGAKFNFIQCAGCKAPVGVIESAAVGLTEILRILVSSLQKLNDRLQQIEAALENRVAEPGDSVHAE